MVDHELGFSPWKMKLKTLTPLSSFSVEISVKNMLDDQ